MAEQVPTPPGRPEEVPSGARDAVDEVTAGRWDLLRAWFPVLVMLAILITFVVMSTLFVVPRIAQLASWIIIAFFLSLALEPAVNWFARRGWRRGVATGLVMLIIATTADERRNRLCICTLPLIARIRWLERTLRPLESGVTEQDRKSFDSYTTICGVKILPHHLQWCQLANEY